MPCSYNIVKWRKLPPAIAGIMTKLGASPILNQDHLKRIEIPVQLMVCDLDVIVSVDETKSVAHQIADAPLAVLPGNKHPIEQVGLPLLLASIKDIWNEVCYIRLFSKRHAFPLTMTKTINTQLEVSRLPCRYVLPTRTVHNR